MTPAPEVTDSAGGGCGKTVKQEQRIPSFRKTDRKPEEGTSDVEENGSERKRSGVLSVGTGDRGKPRACRSEDRKRARWAEEGLQEARVWVGAERGGGWMGPVWECPVLGCIMVPQGAC